MKREKNGDDEKMTDLKHMKMAQKRDDNETTVFLLSKLSPR